MNVPMFWFMGRGATSVLQAARNRAECCSQEIGAEDLLIAAVERSSGPVAMRLEEHGVDREVLRGLLTPSGSVTSGEDSEATRTRFAWFTKRQFRFSVEATQAISAAWTYCWSKHRRVLKEDDLIAGVLVSRPKCIIQLMQARSLSDHDIKQIVDGESATVD